jgi:hypothetical protein
MPAVRARVLRRQLDQHAHRAFRLAQVAHLNQVDPAAAQTGVTRSLGLVEEQFGYERANGIGGAMTDVRGCPARATMKSHGDVIRTIVLV